MDEKQAARAAKAQQREKLQQLRNNALEYRKLGFTYRQIAAQLGISKSTAQRYVTGELNKITRDNREQLLALQLERYDQLLAAVMGNASQGDVFAIDRAVAILRQIERLTGIEAPSASDNDAQATAAEALLTIVQAAKTIHQNGANVQSQAD